MRKTMIGLTVATILASSQAYTNVFAGQERIGFKLDIYQPSLFDEQKHDNFKGNVDDNSGTTSLEVSCSAGKSIAWGMGRVDETCSVTGHGLIKNPNNPSQTAERVGYQGGFKIQAKDDGYTDASTIKANYVRVGGAAAESSSFSGHAMMMPEDPSPTAKALGAALVRKLHEQASGAEAVQFDEQIDSIRFENFTVPHVGLGNTESCSWTGDFIYAYANDSWQGAFDITCGKQKYRLEGNMPLGPVDGSSQQQTYSVNLIVPGAGNGDPFAAADPFATVDGIVGTLHLENSGRKTEDDTYERVKVTGDLVGTNLPLEVVRGYGQIMLVFARTFFGA